MMIDDYASRRWREAAIEAGIAPTDWPAMFTADRGVNSARRGHIAWRMYQPDAEGKHPTWPQIARAFGRRSHTGIMAAAKLHAERFKTPRPPIR